MEPIGGLNQLRRVISRSDPLVQNVSEVDGEVVKVEVLVRARRGSCSGYRVELRCAVRGVVAPRFVGIEPAPARVVVVAREERVELGIRRPQRVRPSCAQPQTC